MPFILCILLSISDPYVSLPCIGSAEFRDSGKSAHMRKNWHTHSHTHLGQWSRWRGRGTSARPIMNSYQTWCYSCWRVLMYTLSIIYHLRRAAHLHFSQNIFSDTTNKTYWKNRICRCAFFPQHLQKFLLWAVSFKKGNIPNQVDCISKWNDRLIFS